MIFHTRYSIMKSKNLCHGERIDMTAKRRQEVVIDGQVYTLMGVESEEYLQNISRYIDRKMHKIRENQTGRRLSTSMAAVLVAINVADDLHKLDEQFKELLNAYYKKEKEVQNYEQRMEKAEKEISSLRDMVSQLQLEAFNARKELNDFIEVFEEDKASGE